MSKWGKNMKFGIILQTKEHEKVWNTLRFANASLQKGHSVKLFLLGEGVELESLKDKDGFDITKKVLEFKENKGIIFACGSCLKIRGGTQGGMCPIGQMSDLVKLVEESDKVLVFG